MLWIYIAAAVLGWAWVYFIIGALMRAGKALSHDDELASPTVTDADLEWLEIADASWDWPARNSCPRN